MTAPLSKPGYVPSLRRASRQIQYGALTASNAGLKRHRLVFGTALSLQYLKCYKVQLTLCNSTPSD